MKEHLNRHGAKYQIGIIVGLIVIGSTLVNIVWKGSGYCKDVEKNTEINIEQKAQIAEIKETNGEIKVHLAGLDKSVEGIEKIQAIILHEVKKLNGSN